MPISKNGKSYFTEEQLTEARCISALSYAQSRGYDLERKGKYYTMKEHDSMVFTESGMWYWNSRGLHGGALEFITQYEHRPFVEAVLTLAGEQSLGNATLPPQSRQNEKQNTQPEKSFELPENSQQYKRLFTYLCKTRKLDGDILKALTSQNKVYPGGEYSNAVFEASIDAISHASLAKLDGKDYTIIHRISIGGCTDFRAVERFLQGHPEITDIMSCLDNDQGGQSGTRKLEKLYGEQYRVSVEVPLGKDWNEELCCRTEEMEKQEAAALEPPPDHEAAIQTEEEMEMG